MPKKLNKDSFFTLAGRKFKVVPIASRATPDNTKPYDESVEYLIMIMPIIQKLTSMFGSATAMVADTIEATDLLAELDSVTLIREIAEMLPKLVAISCHATDDTITSDQVKAMAGSMMNPELMNAVGLQIQAEGILQQINGSELSALVAEANPS